MNIAELLLTVPAITATVQWLKTLGVSGRWSQLAAVFVGIVFSILTLLALYSGSLTQLTSLNIWVRTISEGFLYGLCAAGFYDLANGNLTNTPTRADNLTGVAEPGKHAL